MDSQDPRRLLAGRLRALRVDRGSTQPQLAQALGGVSVPLISSWESQANPRIPPSSRLEAYAALFGPARWPGDGSAGPVSRRDLGDEEQQAVAELRRELSQLRNAALRAGASRADSGLGGRVADEVNESLSAGPWRFADGHRITIVCSQWPRDLLSNIPYTKIDDPDYIELLTYSELDALFELHGHLRAANPGNEVYRRVADKLESDDYTSHLITLGGIDWNMTTSSALAKLDIPVRQVADWDTEGGQYFEVQEDETVTKYRPILEEVGSRQILREDVALFARAVNPYNRKRTLTICSGMYSRGTYGTVRALTDARFRERNAEYLRSRFGDSDSYCVLTRVPIAVNGATLTPDWTSSSFKLFEWSG
jgi:transcriptional regulator with XRE-family HTH domain